ncbi:YjbQ family protein, partial [Candidatus Falkowbacteria bacterium]|nr:YjbQ family protein [Candidatus Falkowbacteria bacterium]
AHIKSALIKPEVVISLENGSLDLGTWQQIILMDFDEKPREREIIVKIIKGE